MRNRLMSLMLMFAIILCGCSKNVSGQQENAPATGTETTMHVTTAPATAPTTKNTTEPTQLTQPIINNHENTEGYDLNELRDFFVPRNGCILFSEVEEKILFYDEVNAKFPVENISDERYGYTAYPVKQGGDYYVFWSYAYYNYSDSQPSMTVLEGTHTQENRCVLYSLYMPDGNADGVYSNIDYFAIKPGISTMADVIQMDPYVEIHRFGSGDYSTSMLDSDTVLSISYRYDQALDDCEESECISCNPKALVVHDVELEEIEDSRSSYREVLSDLADKPLQ